jgi:acetolactate synthase-1/2/3 large subunit
LTNALTACRTAVQGRRRVLVITGDIPVGGGGPAFKNIDQAPLCRSIGLQYFAARTSEEVADLFALAASSALAERPAVLAVPADVLDAPASSEPLRPRPPAAEAPASGEPAPRDDELRDVLAMLIRAERPLILAGLGASTDACRTMLLKLAERTGALVGTTLYAKGLFGDSEISLGVVGGYASDPAAPLLRDTDLVVAFGASLNTYTTAQRSLFAKAPIVQVDIDPDRIGAAIDVELGIVADAEVTLRGLLGLLPRRPGRRWPQHQPEVLASLKAPLNARPDRSTADEIDPGTLATALDLILPDDRVIVLDAGRFTGGPGRFIRVDRPGSVRHTADGGSIGLGMGTALGAAIARPDRPTVLFVGDGGMSMALADLETAARHSARLAIVVMDDRAYGSELRLLAAAGLPGDIATLPPMDFAAVARALGIEASTVHSAAELRDLGPRLRDFSAPLLVHCLIPRDAAVTRLTW